LCHDIGSEYCNGPSDANPVYAQVFCPQRHHQAKGPSTPFFLTFTCLLMAFHILIYTYKLHYLLPDKLPDFCGQYNVLKRRKQQQTKLSCDILLTMRNLFNFSEPQIFSY
jgi:hypothetical protein